MSRSFFAKFGQRRKKQVKRTGSRRSRGRGLGMASLGLESLESRLMLTAIPMLASIPDQIFGQDEVFRIPNFAQFTQAPDAFPDTLQYHYNINWGDGSPDTNAFVDRYHRADSLSELAHGVIGVNPPDQGAQHTFENAGMYTVAVTVFNSEGGSDTKSFKATVYPIDLALTYTAENPLNIFDEAEINEGTPLVLDLSSAGTTNTNISSWTINWGDSVQTIPGNPSSVSHIYTKFYADDVGLVLAHYQISAFATGDHGTSGSDIRQNVVVDDVSPTVTLTPDTPFTTDPDGTVNTDVNEGATVTLHLFESDPGTSEPAIAWAFLWGDEDPNNVVPEIDFGNPSTVTHVYANGNAIYSIQSFFTNGVVLNGGGNSGNIINVNVHNVAPTITADHAAVAVNEGQTVANTGTFGDVPADTVALTASIGTVTDLGGGLWSWSGNMTDGPAEAQTVRITAADEDGGSSFVEFGLAVANVAPTATLGDDGPVNEGSLAHVSFSNQFDPSAADTMAGFHYAYDFNNDNIWDVGDGTYGGSGTSSSATVPASMTADGPASFNVKARIIDKDGGATDYTKLVVVKNVAPTANAGGPYFTFDDTAITLTGTGSDVAGPVADPLTFSWDLDNNGSFETSGASVTFDPVALHFTGAQTGIVQFQVSDGDGPVTFATTSVQLLGQGTLLAGGVLNVVGNGTSGDIVQIGRTGNQINVSGAGSSQSFSTGAVSQILIRTRGGNDIVIVGLEVTTPVVIDGGAGNDLLTAGGGDSVLLGGAGNDILVGGPGNNILVGGDGTDILIGAGGRDLMIGGKGSDLLTGGTGEDILIGGYTTYDASVASLDAVMAVWSSNATFSARVALLTGTGGLLKAGVTVLDDDARDVMDGGSGHDLYFANTNLHDHDVDLIALQSSLDSLVSVN
jgi:Ca2+-binding RTX toxin-like protein